EVGMSCAENDINEVGKFFEDFRQGIQSVLDAFAGRKQSEGEHNEFAFNAEFVFEKVWVDERHVRYAMRDDIDFLARCVKDFLKQLASVLGHDDEAGRKREQFLHDTSLLCMRFVKDGVKRRDHRHLKRTEHWQNVRACGSAENA